MDLWETLGVSRQQGLIGAAGGLFVAVVLALAGLARRNREEPLRGLRLHDR